MREILMDSKHDISNLVFDANFFIPLQDTGRRRLIPQVPVALKRYSYECHVPDGVLREIGKLADLVRANYHVRRVNHDSKLYEEVRMVGIRKRYIKPESDVDPELVCLAMEIKDSAVVTNDRGVARLAQEYGIDVKEPAALLVLLYKVVGRDVAKLVIDVYRHFASNPNLAPDPKRRVLELENLFERVIGEVVSQLDSMLGPEVCIEAEMNEKDMVERLGDPASMRGIAPHLFRKWLSSFQENLRSGNLIGALADIERCGVLCMFWKGSPLQKICLLRGVMSMYFGEYEAAKKLLESIPRDDLVDSAISACEIACGENPSRSFDPSMLIKIADDLWMVGRRDSSLKIIQWLAGKGDVDAARIILRRYGIQHIPEEFRSKLNESLIDLSSKRPDERLMRGKDIPEEMLCEMEVCNIFNTSDGTMLVVWNDRLNSRWGLIPPSSVDVSNASKVRIEEGMAKKKREAAPWERKIGIRGVIELSDDCMLRVERRPLIVSELQQI